jgi:hypothetical protein
MSKDEIDTLIDMSASGEEAAAEARVEVTTIQTVGSKGYDGLAFALVIGS